MKLNQPMKATMSLAAAMGTLALTATSVNAAVIFTEDFESTGVADGAFTPSDWSGSAFSTSVTNGANLLNPTGTGSGWLNPVPPALGEIFGIMHSGTTQQADLTDTFADNTTYTLSFTHFRRDDLAGDEVTAKILTVGGTELASQLFSAVTTTDTYETRTLVWTTSGGAEVGQAIRLQLIDSSGGGNTPQAGIDNISLDATAVPEPSTTALLGLGGLALILRRRK